MEFLFLFQPNSGFWLSWIWTGDKLSKTQDSTQDIQDFEKGGHVASLPPVTVNTVIIITLGAGYVELLSRYWLVAFYDR